MNIALVQPPIAMCTRIALSKAAGVRWRPSSQTVHNARPAAHIRVTEEARRIDEAPGNDIPSASVIAIIVAAVPITMQVL